MIREYVWQIYFKGGKMSVIAFDEIGARSRFKSMMPRKRIRTVKCVGKIVK